MLKKGVQNKDDEFFLKGIFEYLNKNYEEAIQILSKKTKVELKNLYLAKCYYKKGDYEQAERLFKVALDKNNLSSEACIYLARIYKEQKNLKKVKNTV